MRISDWSSDVCSSDLYRAPQFVLQVAEVVVRRFVHAQRLAQRLGVQAPAFDEGGLAAEAAELRQPGQLLLQRQLEMVAGDRFMQEQVLRVPGLAGRQVVGRSEEHTSELQSLMRISYAVFCLKKKK